MSKPPVHIYDNSQVALADCMKYMRKFEDGFFDLAIVDPPYFSGPEKRGHYGNTVSPIGVKSVNYLITPEWSVPDKKYFKELLRVSKHYIIWGCNYYDFHFAPGRIVWDKCNGESSFSDCEIAATDLIDSVRLFPFMWNGMMQGKSMSEGRIMQGNKKLNEEKIHPTQKPVALYSWLLQKFAKPGWKILDTHLGSGSSRIAAYGLGYEFYGCEIVPDYFRAANERFEKMCLGVERFGEHTIVQQNLFTTEENSLNQIK